MTHPRHIPVPGCLNLRDLGGYGGLDGARVREGVLYRSDALSRVPTAQLVDLLSRLGIRTTIDLRADGERRMHGTIDSGSVPGHHLHLSATDRAAHAREARAPSPQGTPEPKAGWVSESRDVGELYLTMLQSAGPAYARCLERFVDPEAHGVAFFCSAGKDRTGVLTALVHGLLGVARDDIVADYSITELVADEVEARSMREEPGIEVRIWSKLPAGVSRAWPQSMQRLCELIDTTYGGWEPAALAVGIEATTITRLRDQMLE